MTDPYPTYESHLLDEHHRFFRGSLPHKLRPDPTQFAALWNLHPDDYHVIKIHGHLVKTPRWQQAYGADYHYTGRTNVALLMPLDLEPVLRYGRAFFAVAGESAAGSSEAHWRSSVGRAFYALLREVLGTLRGWGFALPPRDKVDTSFTGTSSQIISGPDPPDLNGPVDLRIE